MLAYFGYSLENLLLLFAGGCIPIFVIVLVCLLLYLRAFERFPLTDKRSLWLIGLIVSLVLIHSYLFLYPH